MPPRAQVAPRITEARLQEQIVEGLRALGYVVLVTSARSVRQGYGADHGVPDLLVSLGTGLWVGIEVKRAGTVKWSHARQRELWIERRTLVARSLKEACYALRIASPTLPSSSVVRLGTIDDADKDVVLHDGD